MQVDAMQMDPRFARIHYLDYCKRVRAHREERIKKNASEITEAGRELRRVRTIKSQMEREDETLMQCYRQMALGQRVINVGSVIQKAGVDLAKGWLPKLAVGVASWEHCYFRLQSGEAVFCKERWSYNTKKADKITFSSAMFPAETTNERWRNENKHPVYPVRAVVPSIPVHLRPAGDLSDYHILWEAEWDLRAPVDPLLLKHITGPFYTILAQWDLTPLERSVLEGRFM